MKRRFAVAVLALSTVALASHAMPPGRAGSPHGAPAVSAAPVKKLARAKGAEARTVEEVLKGRSSLKDKPVHVHAQVVKVTSGVMGRNWLHLQDGSGKAADGTHDLIATTADKANVGDVVTVKGTVRTDVNIGAGYSYPVLVEDAVLAR